MIFCYNRLFPAIYDLLVAVLAIMRYFVATPPEKRNR